MRVSRDEDALFHEYDPESVLDQYRLGFRGIVYMLPGQISKGIGYDPIKDMMDHWESTDREDIHR